MMATASEAWVTSVVTADQVPSALVLCRSLKKAKTLRSLVVLTSLNLPKKFRDALMCVFDAVLFLEEDTKPNLLSMEDFVKISTFRACYRFGKCVYIPPSTIAVGNVDSIFDEGQDEEPLSRNTLDLLFYDEEEHMPAFIFKPSLALYEKVISGVTRLEKYDGSKLENSLAWILKETGVRIRQQFPAKFQEHFMRFEVETNSAAGSGAKAFLPLAVLSTGFASMMRTRKSECDKPGLLEERVVKYWKNIYKNEVESLLEEAALSKMLPPITCSKAPEPIAIIGMSCRFPQSNNLDEFWRLLIEGRDGTSNPPTFRNISTQPSKSTRDWRNINAGFLSVPVDEFDGRFFGMSPKECIYLDPQHRLLMEVTWEALEDSLVDPRSLHGTSGSVFIGSWTSEYRDNLPQSKTAEFFRVYLGNSIGAAAGKISHFLRMTGPSVATESGCSSSMVAVHLACKSLRSGETNFAIAGGVNLLLNYFDENFIPTALSPEGRCKTFCEKADGFARAEGCGVLILKRLSDAVKDGDSIWALVRGSAISQEGVSKSMGTPTIECEALAMTNALKDAHVTPDQVSYVECHGTGTAVGDPLEVAAIAKAYHSDQRKEPLIIGSVKTNVGHTESCSGITGIMKVVLSMHHQMIPPHRNFVKLNPAIDLDAVPAKIPLEMVEWISSENNSRLAGASSFGLTGTDAHLILEEPHGQIQSADEILNFGRDDFKRPLHIMKLSAKTEESLQAMLTNLLEKIEANEQYSVADICYSANLGRADFNCRAVLQARSKKELAENLRKGKFSKGSISSEKPKICFLFTGQGSQYSGMAKELYETSPAFRLHFDYCEGLFKKHRIEIRNPLWNPNFAEKLDTTIFSQPSIFCVEYALMNLWESWGVKPDFVLGHSVGEYAAAVCAGIVSVEDAVMLVAERSRLVERLHPGKMLVVKKNEEWVNSVLPNFGVDCAAVNSNEQTVISGNPDSIQAFAECCKDRGVKCTILKSASAFHSRLMDPILDEFRRIAANVKVKEGGIGCGYISGMRGSLIKYEDINEHYWINHTREKVSFLKASRTAVQLGCRVFLEIGPQPVLSALTLDNNEEISGIFLLPSIRRNEDNWKTLLSSLGRLYLENVSINWSGFDQFYKRKKVRILPSYPFIRRKYWHEDLVPVANSIHPLLGSPISNASASRLFEGAVSLAAHPYMKDHVVGKDVLFPGAAYLEMFLSGGAATLSVGQNRPMKIENLWIESPLALRNSKSVQLQTVVDVGASGLSNMTIQIFEKIDAASVTASWRRKASATYSTRLNLEDQPTPISFTDNFSKILEKNGDIDTCLSFYKKMASVGLMFGPTFQSVEKIWRKVGTSFKSILAKIRIPPSNDSKCQYLLHPVLIDAMIQLMILFKLETCRTSLKLLLPTKIGKFVWLGGEISGEYFVHVTAEQLSGQDDELSTNSLQAVLLDGKGKALALMTNVEFVRTSVRALKSIIEEQTASMPDMWEEVWRPTHFQKTHQPALNSSKHWIVFHQRDSPMSNFMLKKFGENENGHLLRVLPSDKFKVSDETVALRRNCEEDFNLLINLINKLDLEGILYCWTLDEKARSLEDTLQPFFYLAKSLERMNKECAPRMVTLFDGVVPVEDNHLGRNIFSSTVWGFAKSFNSEQNDLKCRCIDIGGSGGDEIRMEQIFEEILNGEQTMTQVAYHGATRYIPKLRLHKSLLNELSIPPGTDRFRLSLPTSKAIEDLEYWPLTSEALGKEDVEIQVKACALNFRDVLNIIKPSEEFENYNVVGFDIAGVVSRVGANVTRWSVGDRVCGLNFREAFPSQVKLQEEDLYRIGENVTFCEAATLPTVFLTAYLCLAEIANVKKTDTVLIHTASGGVGLCAIQLCKLLGAKIICTAGSRKKRAYLRSLGIQNVFHSRDTRYGESILELTEGRGVDVVLNSLTSDGFKEATLMACAKGARFVEMSKLSIWTPGDVRELRPDVKYTVVDVSSLNYSEWRRLMNILVKFMEDGRITPLPHLRFDAVHIRQALQYLQRAKHVGKICCVMPEVKSAIGQSLVYAPLFHGRGTYLITGGLGGIGFAVCQWMLENGAKYVVLAGRRISSSSNLRSVSELNMKHNAKVIAVQADIGQYSECDKLINSEISEIGYPPLKGIMHCAGTLSDGLIQNQTWQSFSSTLSPKVNGTLHLHELTKDTRLEHFVLFSSVVSLFGLPGQSNHVAGNSFEDCFAHYRHSLGLPATSINWGQWIEVGIATEAELPGIRPLSNKQGLAGLEYALKSQRTQTCVCGIESFPLLSIRLPHISSYVDERAWKLSAILNKSESIGIAVANDFWKQYDSSSDNSSKVELIKEQLVSMLRTVLKLDDNETIGDSQNFQDLGVDSLMTIEIRNSVQCLLGKRATAKSAIFQNNGNLLQLANALVHLIQTGNDSASSSEIPTADEVSRLIREDCVLPDHIQKREGQQVVGLNDIRTILLTGCTGTLGPYIIKELLKLPQISQITCLIRPRKNQTGEDRLNEVLKERGLLEEVDMQKVSCVSGDVGVLHFGLVPEVWSQLVEGIDAIFHCAAKVSHLQFYNKEVNPTDDDIRAANIGGLKNVLEFACTGNRLKQIYHASSLLTVRTTDEDGCSSEEWPDISDIDGISPRAYPITKCCGEILLKEAALRGFPVKAFRFPLISGDSKSGNFVMTQNHAMSRYLFILKTGIMPDDPIPVLVLPVDICASASIQLFFNQNCSTGIFNISHNKPDVDQDFVGVATKLGYSVDIVEYSKFAEKVQECSGGKESSFFTIYEEFYKDKNVLFDILLESPPLRSFVDAERKFGRGSGRNEVFLSKKLSKLLPDYYNNLEGSMNYIHRDFQFAKKQGWLTKYGLE